MDATYRTDLRELNFARFDAKLEQRVAEMRKDMEAGFARVDAKLAELAAKLVEIGRRPKAGQALRLVEVPADAGAGLGCFEQLHGHANGDAFARRLKTAAEQHKGHAARRFVEHVATNFDDVGDTVATYREAQEVYRRMR